MKLVHAAAISTTVVVVLGALMIAPAFLPASKPKNQLEVMLAFSILDVGNVPKWCGDLASFLKANGIEATVFFTGRVAEQNPEYVAEMPAGTDIGSQTYSYTNLTSISDYDLQLEEVARGKEAVDNAGNLYSRVFQAPYGSTDDNIYSLLSRSDIVADFSYDGHYNVFYNGQFIRFNSTTYNGSQYSASFFLSLPKTGGPTVITFDNTAALSQVKELVLKLKTGEVRFVNASGLTGVELTQRR